MQRKYATKMFQMLSAPERHYVSCVACINSYLLTWRKNSMDKIQGKNTTYKLWPRNQKRSSLRKRVVLQRDKYLQVAIRDSRFENALS